MFYQKEFVYLRLFCSMMMYLRSNFKLIILYQHHVLLTPCGRLFEWIRYTFVLCNMNCLCLSHIPPTFTSLAFNLVGSAKYKLVSRVIYVLGSKTVPQKVRNWTVLFNAVTTQQRLRRSLYRPVGSQYRSEPALQTTFHTWDGLYNNIGRIDCISYSHHNRRHQDG